MTLDGARGIDDRFEPAVGGPEVPFLQEARACLDRWLIVEILEGEADLIGTRGLEVTRGQTFERRLLPVRQGVRIAQPDVTCAAQQSFALSVRRGAPDRRRR